MQRGDANQEKADSIKVGIVTKQACDARSPLIATQAMCEIAADRARTLSKP